MILGIKVTGRPAPQGSKRRGGAGQLLEQSPHLAAWRQAVKLAAYRSLQAASIHPSQLPLWRGPIYVHEMTFLVGTDQCLAEGTDEPIGPPDVDKILRATLDALTQARVYADDAQVVDFRVGPRKLRQSPGLPPGAIIKISNEPWENER